MAEGPNSPENKSVKELTQDLINYLEKLINQNTATRYEQPWKNPSAWQDVIENLKKALGCYNLAQVQLGLAKNIDLYYYGCFFKKSAKPYSLLSFTNRSSCMAIHTIF